MKRLGEAALRVMRQPGFRRGLGMVGGRLAILAGCLGALTGLPLPPVVRAAATLAVALLAFRFARQADSALASAARRARAEPSRRRLR